MILTHIFHLATGDYNVIVLYSDEQFIDRLLGILHQKASFYSNILPFPGIKSSIFMMFIHVFFLQVIFILKCTCV